jgi:uncharacterized protein YbjT (DUF2867 family)
MIAVVGSSGTLGAQLLPLLVSRGEPVRAMTRHPATMTRLGPGVEIVQGDVMRPDDVRRVVAGARVVVSAITGFASPAGLEVDIQGNRILAEASVAAGVGRMVMVSILGASADHPMDLFRAKAEAERLVRARGVGWTFVRPTAYLETWLGLIGGPLMASGRTRVFGRGTNPINFVSVVDVARFVDLAVFEPSMAGRELAVPGPENLTLDDLVRLVEASSGRSGSVKHSPPAMMRFLSLVLRPVDRMRAGQVAAALVMDTADMTVDGPTIRSAQPSIPMTMARDVAQRMFGPGGASDGGENAA